MSPRPGVTVYHLRIGRSLGAQTARVEFASGEPHSFDEACQRLRRDGRAARDAAIYFVKSVVAQVGQVGTR